MKKKLSEEVFLFQNVFESSQDIVETFILVIAKLKKTFVKMLMHVMKMQL